MRHPAMVWVAAALLACGDSGGDTSSTETSTGPTSSTTDPTTPTTQTSSPTASSSASTSTSDTSSESSSGSTTGIDPNQDPLEDMGDVELVAGGFMFTEGPVWRAADGVLLFTDIPADTIFRLTPPDTIDTFRGPTMPQTNANGLNNDIDGNLLACEHSTGEVTRTLANDQVEIVADNYQGDTFNSPNDVVSHSNGTIYFTDPTYGGTGTVGFRGVYRVDTQGTVDLVAMYNGPSQPNGIGLAPAEDTLYVVDTMDAVVRSFPVNADGTTEAGADLVGTGGGGDGMAVDVNGNLYVTAGAGVLVLRPDGTSWGTIVFPEQPANCTFGDDDRRTLYVTARTSLYSVRLAVPGVPPP